MPNENLAERNYRRGAIMGLTLAEAFILIAFALLLLFAFWQWAKEKENTEEVRALNELPYEQRISILNAFTEATSMELKDLPEIVPVVDALQKKGIGPERLSTMADALSSPGAAGQLKDKWRFIDQDDARRLLDSVSSLPPDVQRDLADLVESENAHVALSKMAILEELVQSGQDIERLREMFGTLQQADRSLTNIVDKIEHAQGQRQALAAALRNELGGIVSDAGGRIDDAGSIILPDNVLFERGQAEITPVLRQFLENACEPWLTALKTSGVEISEVKIEGHASSEWGASSNPQQAFLKNLDLSQRRSQTVLRECLDVVKDTDIHEWSRSHLIAVGYSSVRPVLRNGQEDRAASRRVVFSAAFDSESLIQSIESEAKTAVAASSEIDG